MELELEILNDPEPAPSVGKTGCHHGATSKERSHSCPDTLSYSFGELHGPTGTQFF